MIIGKFQRVNPTINIGIFKLINQNFWDVFCHFLNDFIASLLILKACSSIQFMLLMQTTFQRNQQVAQFHDRHKEQRFFIARVMLPTY
ncbi:Uncharacterised protein [Shigella sonnei]|nr:Uncharacterised protein [Shigella sonnei]